MSDIRISDDLHAKAAIDNRTFQSHLIRIISIPVLLIFFLLAYFHFQNDYRNSVDDEIDIFESVLFDTLSLEKNFSEMATGIRGFTISGRKELLDPYKAGLAQISGFQESVFRAISGDYVLSRKFRKVIDNYNNWKEYAVSVMAVRKGRGSEGEREAEAMLAKGDSRLSLLRKSIVSFKNLVREERKKRRQKLAKVVKITNVLEVIFTISFALFIAYLLTRQLKNLTGNYRNLLQQRLENMREVEESSKAKDHFLANMSHEIRTPLGAIIGFSELISEKDCLDAESRSHIAFIKRNSKHLLSLVDDLFDLSRVSADKLEIFLEECVLKELIHDIENIFSSKVLDKKIELNFRFDTKIPQTIKTDQVRVKQILSNLVGNAIKFSPNKSRVDVIFTFKNETFIVDVIDQGIGIAPESQALVFETFSQADVKHSRKFGGAGLGLSISRELAEALGGELALLDSTVNLGSHFQLKLPIQNYADLSFDQKDWNSIGSDDSKPVKAKGSTTDLSNSNILLVEDSKENQILFKIYIESAKANLTIVDNGTEAVRKALTDDYDLILMDIQMPGIDGYEALSILRDSSYNKKIIALTAHTMKGEKEKCLAAGFDGYLSKPISQDKLLSTIKHSIYS